MDQKIAGVLNKTHQSEQERYTATCPRDQPLKKEKPFGFYDPRESGEPS